MFAALDIGNSKTKLAIFKRNAMQKVYNFDTDTFSFLTLTSYLRKHKIDFVGISSVVRKFDSGFANSLSRINFTSKIITSQLSLPIKLKIKNKTSLGSDRICSAAYAYTYFKKKENVICINSGTAITIDVVLRDGSFIGGLILPGIYTQAQSLFSNTSKLPIIKKFNSKVKLIGDGTDSAIQSGILNITSLGIDTLIKKLESHYKRRFKIIISGGSGKLLSKNLITKHIFVENIVLKGIQLILRIR